MPGADTATPCALLKRSDYSAPLDADVEALFQAARLPFRRGEKILVKPNLLTGASLACTHPALVAAACRILLDMGCAVEVADSPGFGGVQGVAEAVGLADALAPLGLKVLSMNRPVSVRLDLAAPFRTATLKVSRRALECDRILSLPKIKAHAMLRLTLAVKNCFGCVCGLRKALVHAREGREPECFAAALAALFAALPPVAALADGVIAMHVTGPLKGEPYPLGLVGACGDAPALDSAIMEILGVSPRECPLAEAVAARRGGAPDVCWPLLKPADFDARDFRLPVKLAPTSFSPGRLCKSLARRIWSGLKRAS